MPFLWTVLAHRNNRKFLSASALKTIAIRLVPVHSGWSRIASHYCCIDAISYGTISFALLLSIAACSTNTFENALHQKLVNLSLTHIFVAAILLIAMFFSLWSPYLRTRKFSKIWYPTQESITLHSTVLFMNATYNTGRFKYEPLEHNCWNCAWRRVTLATISTIATNYALSDEVWKHLMIFLLSDIGTCISVRYPSARPSLFAR